MNDSAGLCSVRTKQPLNFLFLEGLMKTRDVTNNKSFGQSSFFCDFLKKDLEPVNMFKGPFF